LEKKYQVHHMQTTLAQGNNWNKAPILPTRKTT
jgi:hypothetical protein